MFSVSVGGEFSTKKLRISNKFKLYFNKNVTPKVKVYTLLYVTLLSLQSMIAVSVEMLLNS